MMQNNEWRSDFQNAPKNGDFVLLRHTIAPDWWVLCKWCIDNSEMPWRSSYNNHRFTEDAFNQFFEIPQPPKENENDTE